MTRVVTDLDERAALRHTRGRKRADLVIDERFPQGRDAVWAAIRKLRTFTKLDLQASTRVPVGTLQTYLRGLTLAGYLKCSDDPPRVASTWTLVRDVGVEAPRVTRDGKEVTQGSGRERMWRSMRILKDFSLAELVATASRGGAPVASGEAGAYVRMLLKARYLRSSVRPTATGRAARYLLIPALDTGPRAPMVQKIKQVFDPNTGKVMWPLGASNG